MPQITLAELREAADRKYGPFVVQIDDTTSATLVSPIRLSGKDRARLASLLDDVAGEDAEERMKDAVRLAAKTKADGDRLIRAVGDDMAVLLEILQGYGAASQAGEASPSVD